MSGDSCTAAGVWILGVLALLLLDDIKSLLRKILDELRRR